MSKPSSAEIRQLILNVTEPIIFKEFIQHWNLLNWDMKQWQSKFSDKKLPFRIGNKKSDKIQWEHCCDNVQMTFDEFLNEYDNTSTEKWGYFDYKYMQEWFNAEINLNFDWSCFGFPNLDEHDTTVWIGSEGAHTNCHVDTYGCNLIAQIYGQKQWILLPPNEISRCKPTRVPYEESSIYSELNFYSPKDTHDFKDIQEARLVVLNPGDVLLVPRKWMHYVENLTTAISMNTWIQLDTDEECRVEESLVRLFISHMAKENLLSTNILNPNESQLLISNTNNEMIRYLKYAKDKLKVNEEENSRALVEPPSKIFKLSTNEKEIRVLISKILNENNENISVIKPLMQDELLKALRRNCLRYEQGDNVNELSIDESDIIKSLINSFCHPDVIKNVKDIFLNKSKDN